MRRFFSITRWEFILSTLVTLFFLAAAITAFLLMAALITAGFWQMGKAVLVCFGFLGSPEHAKSAESGALGMTLKGLEFLFLAPLGYLALRSLYEYVNSVRKSESTEQALQSLSGVKSLIFSLMIAIIATDLVGRVLSKPGLTYEAAITESLAILVLTGFLFVIERHKRKNNSPPGEHQV